MSKKKIYLMGLVTLLLFPIPAFLVLYFVSDISFHDFLDLDSFQITPILWGAAVGIAYAFFANELMKFKVFKSVPLRVDELVRSLNLTVWDSIFLSLCAGIGEELLFRAGVQTYLGPILTSILFVAVHGYINPTNWRQSLYGIVVLPLSFILGYGLEWYGLWFSIAVHAAYDFTLFVSFKNQEEEE